jgi:hypothetical protein
MNAKQIAQREGELVLDNSEESSLCDLQKENKKE